MDFKVQKSRVSQNRILHTEVFYLRSFRANFFQQSDSSKLDSHSHICVSDPESLHLIFIPSSPSLSALATIVVMASRQAIKEAVIHGPQIKPWTSSSLNCRSINFSARYRLAPAANRRCYPQIGRALCSLYHTRPRYFMCVLI